MVTRKKSILFFAACLIVSLIFSAFAIIAEPAKADDESASTPITFETYAKTTVGGSIRKTEGSTGLRFRWEMSEANYNAFQSSEDTVTYGMIIAPLSYNTANIINAENVFGENAVYTDKANEEGKTRIINLCGTELTSATGEASTVYFFNGAITNIAEENYTTKFIGVGYIGIQKQGEETTTYYFADNDDCVKNARTVVYVAESYKNNTADTVLDGFIKKGYENLKLSLTGELNSNDDFDALVKNGADGIIYGSGTYTITKNVDESEFVYAGEKLPGATFTYPHYDNVIEDFNSASSIVAAVGKYVDDKGVTVFSKEHTNESAEWHAEFNGRYGVLSLTPINYYSEYTLQQYRFKSSIRNENFYVDNWDNWDYISVWIYIPGVAGEYVTVTSKHTDGATAVACNEWFEYKISKDNAKLIGGDTSSGAQNIANMLACDKNSTWVNNFLSLKLGENDNRTIYLDRVSYEKDTVALTYTGDVKQNSDITISATYGTITDGFTYFVKEPDKTAFVQLNSTTYNLSKGGVYTFKAICTSNNAEHMATLELVVYADNEIECFSTSDSIKAAYGNSNDSKGTQNPTAVWHKSFKGRNGVLELGRANYYESGQANCYHVKSTFRDNTFYTNNEEWDYISIWVYVAGEEDSSVTIGLTQYFATSYSIFCNAWTEIKFYKDKLHSISGGKDSNGNVLENQTSLSDWLASTGPTKVNNYAMSTYNSFISIKNDDKEKDITIYLDSITYEKNVESND